MNIAMLARNPNLYSHQRLVEAAEERGHEIDIINTLRCYMNITSHRPSVYYNGECCGIAGDGQSGRVHFTEEGKDYTIISYAADQRTWVRMGTSANSRQLSGLRLGQMGSGGTLRRYVNHRTPRHAELLIGTLQKDKICPNTNYNS